MYILVGTCHDDCQYWVAVSGRDASEVDYLLNSALARITRQSWPKHPLSDECEFQRLQPPALFMNVDFGRSDLNVNNAC
jgi:hypothetical protein